VKILAIKDLNIMNLVCKRDDLDNVIKDLILNENCQFINSYSEIDNNDFAIGMTEENADEILNMEDVEPIKNNKEITEYLEKIDNLSRGLQYQPTKSKDYITGDVCFECIKESVDGIIENLQVYNDKIEVLEEKLEKLKSLNFMKTLRGYDINLMEIMDMDNFSVKIGYLSKEKRKRISRNYENISAVVFHLSSQEEKELYLIISPKSLDVEMSRILRSTNFKEIDIDNKYLGVPEEAEKIINRDIEKYENKLDEVRSRAEDYIDRNKRTIDEQYSKLIMSKKIDQIKEKIGASYKYAYVSAWVPKNHSGSFNFIKKKYENVLIKYKTKEENTFKIERPTYIKNNWFFEPFEQLVNMYGVPSNDEVDPTMFFGIAYTFLFGAMFGDLGQGLVIMLAGLYLSKKKNNSFGKIFSRVGIGSVIFGFFYDSFFGYEEVISEIIPLNIFFRPMENIETILFTAILVGLIFLFISYIYSIFIKHKNKDVEGYLFDRNGINGLILFVTLILIGLGLVTGNFLINKTILFSVVIISALILLLKEPLACIVKGESIKHKFKAEYYIESGFDILETFLSLFSNSISFIRVGAFAINHVGLFMAFHTLSKIIGTTTGNIIMFILGNVIIIGLEGLIVFIQGLRLFYYEMFSKYYSGDGTLFIPEKIEEV